MTCRRDGPVDPPYGYHTVNVIAQERVPTSLLRWMRRLIAVRQEYKAFGRGTWEPVDAANRRVRLKQAGFPVPKTLEPFNVADSSIPRPTFEYIASLEPGSRRTMVQALDVAAKLLTAGRSHRMGPGSSGGRTWRLCGPAAPAWA